MTTFYFKMTVGIQLAEGWITTAVGYTVDFGEMDTSGPEYFDPIKRLPQLYEVARKGLEHIYMYMNTKTKISFAFIK
jgi:hypothetical protein